MITGNIFDSIADPTYLHWEFGGIGVVNYQSIFGPITNFGTFNNNHYCHPTITQTISKYEINKYVDYTLPAWQQVSGQDLNSTDTTSYCQSPTPTPTPTPVATPHPADTSGDFKITANEATTYGACWRSAPTILAGCLTTGATMDYAVRAGTIWNSSSDGSYHFDSTKTCPLCWVP